MNFNNNPILYPKDDGLKPTKDNGNPPCYPKEDGLNPFKAIVERINALESVTRNYGDSFETKQLTVSENAQIENLNATEGTVDTLNSNNATVTTLNSTNATVNTLNSTNGNIENAEVKKLHATEGTVDTFKSTTSTITNLNSTNCNIKNAQIENLRTNRLTWDSPNIDVENAKVEKLDVTKEIKVENLKTEEPILSNAVVGYDGNGKMIPIKIAELEEKVDKDLANATGTLSVANGGTGVTTQADINKAFINNLDVGTSDVTDGTEFVSSYASDNGFSSTEEGSLHTPYKRQFIKVWNYIKGKISSVLGLTKDTYSGISSKSSFLDEYVGAGGTRPTSGNIVPKDASEYGGMRKDVVTSSMTDSGRPDKDGHLLTMFWDSTYRFDSQLFVSNEKQPVLKVRGKGNSVDYGPWTDIITSNNIGSQTVASATSVVNYGDTSKTIKIGYGGAGATVDNLSHIAGYLTGGTQIKDVSKSVLQSWVGLYGFDYTVDSQKKFNDLLSILKSGTPSTYQSIAIIGGSGGGEHGEYLYTVDSNSSDANLNNASLIGFNNPKIVITINNANTFKVFKNGLIKDIDFNVGGTVNAGKTVTLLHNCTYNNGKIALNNVSATFNIVDTTLSNVINDECKSFVGCTLNDCETIQSAFTNCSSEMLYVSTDTNIANKYSFNKCGIHLDMKKTNMAQLETVTINISSMTDSKLTVLDNSSKLKKIILNIDASDSLSEIVGNNDKKYSIYEPYVKRVSKSVSPSMRSKAYLSYYDESHTPIFSNDGVKFYLDEAMTQQVHCYSTFSNNKTIWMFSLENDNTHCYSSLTFNKEITYSERYNETVADLKLSDFGFGDEFILNGNSLKTYICRNDESGTLLYSNNNGTTIYISPHINDNNLVRYANTDSNEKMFILGNFAHLGKTLGAFNEKPLFETVNFVTPQLLEVTALKDNYAVQVVSNYDVPINVENAFSTKIKNS